MPPGPGKNKSGSGLKILWIPGRKKHHDKGTYTSTKYTVEHKHADRKNEPWSLGGSKTHDEILAGHDKDDKDDLINPTTPITTVLPSASLGVTTVNLDDCSETGSDIKLEKCVIKDIEYVVYSIRDSIQSLTSSDLNHSTKSAGDGDDKDGKRSAGRSSTKKDFDSIECLDDLDGKPTIKHQNGKGTASKMKSCKKSTKEDKAVKCLYYTMMCCECTIS